MQRWLAEAHILCVPMQEARSIPSLYDRGGTASRPSRIWLSGPKQGKTHFMRDCALTLALLHPDALVGYCMYNECQMTPQQIWQLYGPHVPQGDMAFSSFSGQLSDNGMTPFFFSDELEFLYEQRITAPLEQVRLVGRVIIFSGALNACSVAPSPRQERLRRVSRHRHCGAAATHDFIVAPPA
jgi:hypothetical protein